MRSVYMTLMGVDGQSAFVKELDFYRSQGGFSEAWGRRWIPVVAESIEGARTAALLVGQEWRCHCIPKDGDAEHFHEYTTGPKSERRISPECPAARVLRPKRQDDRCGHSAQSHEVHTKATFCTECSCYIDENSQPIERRRR